MEKLIHIDNDIVLNIIGDGDERVELIQNIKDKGIEKNVLLLGTCHLDEIIEELIDSSVFITTSEVETFNLAVLQAMSVGLPVVCFENESTKSLITNEIDGILVENRNLESFSDNIIDLINDLDKRNNIGECAIEKSINYDVNVIKREWIKLFK
jgi:glycosyltransferase involved in cell wall biosynthesis